MAAATIHVAAAMILLNKTQNIYYISDITVNDDKLKHYKFYGLKNIIA